MAESKFVGEIIDKLLHKTLPRSQFGQRCMVVRTVLRNTELKKSNFNAQIFLCLLISSAQFSIANCSYLFKRGTASNKNIFLDHGWSGFLLELHSAGNMTL